HTVGTGRSPPLVGREVHDGTPEIRPEVADVIGMLRQHLGVRVLNQIVGIDVPTADHCREPPERLVQRPQSLDPVGTPPLFQSQPGPAPAYTDALHLRRHTVLTAGAARM